MKLERVIGSIILAEALSLVVFFNPGLQTIIFFLICLGVLLVSLIDLRYGVLVALAELFIGGMGYLFVLPAGGLNLSIRMGLFLVLLAVALARSVRNRKLEVFKSRFFSVYFLLLIFVVLGLISGYFRGNQLSYLFFDSNAFFFLGYLVVFYEAFQKKDDLKIIWPVFWGATLWLALKTLLVFFIFTHGFTAIIPDLYKWIRDAGLGEITPAPGGFYRVFFQSQIYLVCGLIIVIAGRLLRGESVLFFLPKGRPDARVGAPQVSAKKNRTDSPLALLPLFLIGVLFFSAILLTFSRSFWVGLITVLLLTFGLAFVYLRISGRQMIKSLVWTLGVGLGGFLLVLLLSYFPYPARGAFSFANLLGERAISVSDAAAATRWAEVQPLWSAIKKHWLIGSGFGATITFKTQDPRILAVSPTGQYTTYAFEWGWLDIWLKIGFIGLLVYWGLLWRIIKRGWKNIKYLILNIKYFNDNGLEFGLIMSLAALIVINVFTPYLNHPLGLGWVMLVGLAIDRTAEL